MCVKLCDCVFTHILRNGPFSGLPDGGTRDVPKHVGDLVTSDVYTYWCTQIWFYKLISIQYTVHTALKRYKVFKHIYKVYFHMLFTRYSVFIIIIIIIICKLLTYIHKYMHTCMNVRNLAKFMKRL
jgi:hypothetical protein